LVASATWSGESSPIAIQTTYPSSVAISSDADARRHHRQVNASESVM
jgi:hypothetical protein